MCHHQLCVDVFLQHHLKSTLTVSQVVMSAWFYKNGHKTGICYRAPLVKESGKMDPLEKETYSRLGSIVCS